MTFSIHGLAVARGIAIGRAVLVASSRVDVAHYFIQPDQVGAEIDRLRKARDAVIEDVKTHQPDFICLNFANADMVGHTGDYNAVTKAVETVDACAKRVIETGLKKGYSFSFKT